MQKAQPLSSFICISSKFQRSVNVAADFGTVDALKGYILNDSSLACLETMNRFLSQTNQRAFTWTGPYGTGKSSLALFLASLLGGKKSVRDFCKQTLLSHQEYSESRFNKLFSNQKWEVITIIGRNGSLADDFSESTAVTADNPREAIDKFLQNTQKHPTLLIIDELGKFLESGNSDNCYFLQELAESVNRFKYPVIVVGILHQSFDAYASTLTNVQQEEWSKVQGRFVDIPLLMSANETIQLIGQSIEKHGIALSQDVKKLTKSVVSGLTIPVDEKSFFEHLCKTWPLNPVTSLLLAPLSRRRFLQNTRSVFNFLTSKEPYAFSVYLDETFYQDSRLFNLDRLWDYLVVNFEQAILSSHTEGHRFLIACDCVERTEHLYGNELLQIVKAVAILDLFRQGSGLEPTLETIAAGLYPMNKKTVKNGLNTLVNSKIIIEKRYLNGYGLFEGSDFNLDGALKKTISEYDQIDAAELADLLDTTPVIANRHYYQTGTLRWFSTELTSFSNLETYLKSSKPKANATGRLVLCLPDQSDSIALEQLKDTVLNTQEISFVGIPENSESIKVYARELQALNKIAKDPQLEGDSTARKELHARITWISEQLKSLIAESFNSSSWIDNLGKIHKIEDYSQLNRMLSNVCDTVFVECPKINNELINREQLSSNITSARRQLVTAMVEHEKEERLGLTGFPPEAMIYASLLKNQFHFKNNKDGLWFFTKPKQSSSFYKVWTATDNFLNNNKQPRLIDLYDLWRKSPYGMKAGFMPILAMAYVLANSKNISLYLDGVFQPDLSQSLLDMWTVDPKSVSFRYIDYNNEVNQLLVSLSNSLSNLTSAKVSPNPLSIARSLVKEVLRCPQWALKTIQISDSSRKFRDVVLKAWDPLKLIFEDLPNIFSSENPKIIVKECVQALKEIQEVTPQMLNQIRKELLVSLDSDGDCEHLALRAENIIDEAPTIQLKAFIARIKNFKTTKISDSVIEGFIALATTKPKMQWTDHDIVLAIQKIREWGFEFRHLEGLASMHKERSSRRMVSIVVSGKAGQQGSVLDIPHKIPVKLKKIEESLSDLLKNLSSEEVLQLLIEETIKTLGRYKKNA